MPINSNTCINESNKVTMFHDGDCVLCKHEVKLMQKLDIKKSIRWVDISKDKEALKMLELIINKLCPEYMYKMKIIK